MTSVYLNATCHSSGMGSRGSYLLLYIIRFNVRHWLKICRLPGISEWISIVGPGKPPLVTVIVFVIRCVCDNKGKG